MGEERLVKRVYRTNLKGNVRGGKERVTDEEKPEWRKENGDDIVLCGESEKNQRVTLLKYTREEG